ncbi:hypothetical protein GQ55_4G254700 [Panicum hallii var. hallii]|uniref:Uncharacterized protein n=1 Tax=Panicum hallii var. hallii TaxID=1504633 RepID=A0A2T7E042_9POAL|nr:hypothetical protein GQ55_4G254700 [Panicum hallii var. hallii]
MMIQSDHHASGGRRSHHETDIEIFTSKVATSNVNITMPPMSHHGDTTRGGDDRLCNLEYIPNKGLMVNPEFDRAA